MVSPLIWPFPRAPKKGRGVYDVMMEWYRASSRPFMPAAEGNKRSKQLLREHFKELEGGSEDKRSGADDSDDDDDEVRACAGHGMALQRRLPCTCQKVEYIHLWPSENCCNCDGELI